MRQPEQLLYRALAALDALTAPALESANDHDLRRLDHDLYHWQKMASSLLRERRQACHAQT